MHKVVLILVGLLHLSIGHTNQASGGAALVISGDASETRVLTVTGKGFAKRLVFQAYDTARFEPYDDDGYLLPDGSYAYELTSYPSRPVVHPPKRPIQKINFDNVLKRNKNQKRGTVTAGTFRISGGSVVPFVRPNQIEGALQ